MGAPYFTEWLLFLAMTSFSSCLGVEEFYGMEPAIAKMNHIYVTPGSGVAESKGMLDGTGVSNAMIVNGAEVDDSRFPYMVSIQIVEQKYKRYHICGAILVSTNKAVTAAHCMDYFWGGVEHFAAVGFTRLSKHGQALVKIVDAVIHPRYRPNKEGFPNDIAVITLEEHVELTDRVQLANVSVPGDPSFQDQYCYVTGWGFTEDYYSYPDELRYAVLISLGKRDCFNFFKIFETRNLLRSHHTCAWLWPYSACYGDSGGPLVCNGQVVGITSWAADCTGCFPTVFAKISSFWKWISKQL